MAHKVEPDVARKVHICPYHRTTISYIGRVLLLCGRIGKYET